MESNEFPLYTCRQAVLKLNSALADIDELNYVVSDDNTKNVLTRARDMTESIITALIVIASEYMDEEEFLLLNPPMENIELFEEE